VGNTANSLHNAPSGRYSLSLAPNEFKLFQERCKTKWLVEKRGSPEVALSEVDALSRSMPQQAPMNLTVVRVRLRVR
jgi:hypothetical protein